MSGTNELLTAALEYAARGWSVFPLHTPVPGGCSCRNTKCNCVGKHPRTKNGFLDATTDEAQIRRWWSQWPDANIGIRTGSVSGLLVVDVDNKGGKQGGENLAAIAARFRGLPTTLTATTGSGKHLFFKHPGTTVRGSASKLTDGVDVRADGGYVVAAPSLHANGKRYGWQNVDQPLAETPAWLITKLNGRKEITIEMEDAATNTFTDAPVAHEGERNDTLYRLGCALRGQQSMERDEIAPILLQYNEAKCKPPLDEHEVLRIVDSVCTHPPEFASGKSGKRLEQNPLYWFQFNTREWFADQNLALMDDSQTGWYIRLKAYAWDKGGFLPADHSKLWKLAKAKSLKVFDSECEIVLAEYEMVVQGGVEMLKNSRMAAQYSDILDKWMKKKEAGEASRAARLMGQIQPSATTEARVQ